MGKTESQSDALETVVAEFTSRCRHGESPSIEGYAHLHPELADEIRELLPTIGLLEQIKHTTTRGGSSGPVTGHLDLAALGDFRIVREIGRGGMGIVYEAVQQSLGRRVAVKVLPRQILLDRGRQERFEREARTAAHLHHTNIVPIFGIGQHEGHHYLVMQYIDGIGLDAVIRELRRHSDASPGEPLDVLFAARHLIHENSPRHLPAAPPPGSAAAAEASRPHPHDRQGDAHWRTIAQIGLETAEALAYAHAQGILHRDIKPGNLLLDVEGTVWVADFGLAKAVDQEGVTQSGDVVGTLRYMAPEQLEGRAEPRSDVYSLGLTLFELATLQPALRRSGAGGAASDALQRPLSSSRRLRPAMPRDLKTIIAKSTAVEPARRYESAAALAEDLRRFLEERPIRARRIGPLERLWSWTRRNKALAGLMGTALGLLLILLVVLGWASVQTTLANRRTRAALAAETWQRQRAEMTANLAQAALDTIFSHLAPNRPVPAAGGMAPADQPGQVTPAIPAVLSPETADLLEHMLVFYERLATQEGDSPDLLRKVADASRRVGEINRHLGYYDKAQAAYEHALAVCTQLRDKTAEGPTLATEIGRLGNDLGVTRLLAGSVPQAQEQFRQSLPWLEPAEREPSADPERAYELARCLFLLGRGPPAGLLFGQQRGRREPTPGFSSGRRYGRDASPGRETGPRPHPDRRGRPDDPAQRGAYLQRSVAVLSRLVAESPGCPDHQHLLALVYREQARHLMPQDEAAGRAGIDRAAGILEQLVAALPQEHAYQFDLAETWLSAAVHRRDADAESLAAAEQHLRKAVGVSERLVADHPGMPQYVMSLTHSLHALALLLRERKQDDQAEASLRRAIALQAALLEELPEVVPFRHAMVAFQTSLAELLQERNNLAEAEPLLLSAVATLETIEAKVPPPHRPHRMVWRQREMLAQVQAALRDSAPVREPPADPLRNDPDHPRPERND